MPTTKYLIERAKILGECLLSKNLTIATAESCTGGGIAYFLTHIPGSSQWFERGFVTYSNQAKVEMLDIDPEIIQQHGAVSEKTAEAMAKGAIQNSSATMAIAVTGIAGPQGGTVEKPVGTVWFSWASEFLKTQSQCIYFKGPRKKIREDCIAFVFNETIKYVNQIELLHYK